VFRNDIIVSDVLDPGFVVGIHSRSPLRTAHVQSSGIALHAAAAGKMVVGANNGWFMYMMSKFSLGRLCQPQDSEHLAEDPRGMNYPAPRSDW
jgi:hypothetical protein